MRRLDHAAIYLLIAGTSPASSEAANARGLAVQITALSSS
jgi:predicted membrane channel-forming protein YqfA (hemolysin III family)